MYFYVTKEQLVLLQLIFRILNFLLKS